MKKYTAIFAAFLLALSLTGAGCKATTSVETSDQKDDAMMEDGEKMDGDAMMEGETMLRGETMEEKEGMVGGDAMVDGDLEMELK